MAAAWHGVKRVGRALVSPMICRLPTGQLEDPEGGTPHNPPAPPAAAPRSDPCALPLPAQHHSAADGELAARRGQPESPQTGRLQSCPLDAPRPAAQGGLPAPRAASVHWESREGQGWPPRGGGVGRDMKQPWRQGRDSI